VREGTKGPLRSRFGRVIVWLANGLVQGKALKEEPEELLIEWPESEEDPWKFWLSSLPAKTSWKGSALKAKGRFRR